MFLDEIAARLVSQGVGVSAVGTSKNIFKSSAEQIPSGSGQEGPYLTLVDTGGAGSNKTHNDTATEVATMSLTIRATDYSVAETMARAAYNALGGANGLYNITLSGVPYVSIKARQRPTDIGTDLESRAMLVFNIEAEKQPS